MKLQVKTLRSIVIRLGIVVAVVLFYRCPVNYLFAVDCPGCGLTRAFLAALRLDFRAAFAYHPLFLPVGIVTAYLLFYEICHPLFRISQRLEKNILIVVAFLLVTVWMLRQFI